MTGIQQPNGNDNITTDRDMEPLAALTIGTRIAVTEGAKRKVIYNQDAGSYIRKEKVGMLGGVKMMEMVGSFT